MATTKIQKLKAYWKTKHFLFNHLTILKMSLVKLFTHVLIKYIAIFFLMGGVLAVAAAGRVPVRLAAVEWRGDVSGWCPAHWSARRGFTGRDKRRPARN